MEEATRKFLPVRVKPEPGDKLVAAPCWMLKANMVQRGLFTRLSAKPVTALVNAATGAAEIIDGELSASEDFSAPSEIKLLPVKLSRAAAEEAVLAAVAAESPRGWRRGIRHSELFFSGSGRDVLALRLYIVRGPLLIDAFSGESSGAASLIEFLI